MTDQATRNKDNASAASSSSAAYCSPSICYKTYDVFINHRGPDVKTTFATDLYRSLTSRGLRVFLDKPELEVGQNITPQILHAIETSSIHIAIFSSTYAESNWCLDELLHMLKEFHSRPNEVTIIPVFYAVKPWELRWTKGAYSEALRNHEKKQRFDFDTIQRWKRALSEAAEISGFDLEAFNGNVGQLLDDVLRCVWKAWDKTPLKYVAEHPTGLKEKLQEFESTVLWPEKANVVGIVGTGGVGKTTLATEFFSKRRSNYNRSCFLYDVRENAAKGSLPSLQRKLLKELAELDLPIDSTHEGTVKLVTHLCSSHILIILDDVDKSFQLEAFLPIKNVMSPSSLILVTSRDKKVLKKAKIAETSIYELEGLNRQHSLELFCFHAFGQPHPQPEFAHLAHQFITACDGLPLSLKVLGALLFGENERSYWQDILNRLHHLPEEIQERLRISYYSLNSQERQIFLNICCFFIGEDRETAGRIWDSMGLLNIENKCLFKVDSEYNIKMHDHIRDLGRSIAEEEKIIPRGLCNHTTRRIDDLLEESSRVIIEVRGIKTVSRADPILESKTMMSLAMPGYKRWSFEVLGKRLRCLSNDFRFRGILNLQLLATEQGYPERILMRARSPQLMWLRWYKCAYSCLPSWIPMESLRVLEVGGAKLTSLWQGDSRAPLQLRELNICAPLSGFPKSIGQLKHLEKIVIFHSLFRTVPKEFCQLRFLKYLELRHCPKMTALPNSFGALINLQHIDFTGSLSLQKLPNSFRDLTRLRHLELRGCCSFTISNGTFGNITTLEYIGFSGCSNVKELPEEFCDICSLKYLQLRDCSKMMLLPDSLGALSNLQHIDLSGALSLQMLPNSFGNLTRLKHLDLKGCCNLTISNGAFGNITTLEHIDFSGCSNVKELPSQIAHQRYLQKLDLCGTQIKQLPSGIGDICKLEALELGGEPLLEIMPTLLGCLKSLKELFLLNCLKLKCLPDSFRLLTQLIELKICRCGIEYLPQDLIGMKNLEILIIEDCPLRELPFKEAKVELDFADDKCMVGLKQLVLARTQISEVFFHEGVCPNLQHLFLVECLDLREIGGLSRLAKLQYLYVSLCPRVEALPGVEHHLISFKEPDNTEDEHEWLSFLRKMGRITNAMIYVNKCYEILEPKALYYLIDQWWLLLLAANGGGGVDLSRLFLSRSAGG